MKKLLFIIMAGITSSYAQDKKEDAKHYYLATLDSITETVFPKGYAIYINEYKLSQEDKAWLNKLSHNDFPGIEIMDQKSATMKFGKDGENGAVVLTPVKDELLDVKYYTNIQNSAIKDKLSTLQKAGTIKGNPLLILDGVPLRGDDIAAKLNALSKSAIEKVQLLKRDAAIAIYGLRAVPGVLLITTRKI